MSDADRKRGRDLFERVQRHGGNPEGVFLAHTTMLSETSVEAAADFEDGWIEAAEEAEQDSMDMRHDR